MSSLLYLINYTITSKGSIVLAIIKYYKNSTTKKLKDSKHTYKQIHTQEDWDQPD